MKNMKVSMKLISSFLTVILLAAAIGVTGIIGLNSMSNAAESMYSEMGVPLGQLGLASEYFQRIRVQLRNVIIYTGDAEHLSTVETDLTDRMKQFEIDMELYEPTIVTEDGKNLFNATMEEYESVMKTGVASILAHAKDGMEQTQLLEEMTVITASAENIANNMRELTQLRLTVMSDANDGTTVLFNTLLIVIAIVIAIALGVSLLLAFYISGMISKPLIPLAGFMKQAGITGDIVLREEDTEVIGAYAQRKDEIGQTIAAAAAFVKRLNEVSHTLETVAQGDLTAELVPLTDRDTLGLSLQRMTENLNTMFGDVNSSTSQVSTGASQVADGAQALAAGATQQAASIEELSSSIAEIADRTKHNAVRAEEAAKLAGTIKQSAENGSRHMDEMMSAVTDINQSSQDISKVIKVIDDIAFQTNILALNAAVEAARAGQHGRGFAVVAEEVRNLATKSADAAKDTEGMIANSLQKAELGVRIARETSAGLTEIVSGISESNALVSEIAASSEEQSLAISQVNVGIDQVAQVVQQNSATAQESAAASEEMSGQAAILQQLVSQFKLKGDGYNHVLSMSTKSGRKAIAADTGLTLVGSSGRLGKY